MNRRSFLKGFALLTASPFVPNIELNTLSVESLPADNYVPIFWTNKSGAEIIEDIQHAIKMIRGE